MWSFRWNKRNCPLYTGVHRAGFHCIEWWSISKGRVAKWIESLILTGIMVWDGQLEKWWGGGGGGGGGGKKRKKKIFSREKKKKKIYSYGFWPNYEVNDKSRLEINTWFFLTSAWLMSKYWLRTTLTTTVVGQTLKLKSSTPYLYYSQIFTD